MLPVGLARLIAVHRGGDQSTDSESGTETDQRSVRDGQSANFEQGNRDADYDEYSDSDSEVPSAKVLLRRQLPFYVDQMRTMIAELEDPCAQADQLISLGLAGPLPSAPITFKELSCLLAAHLPPGEQRTSAMRTSKEKFFEFVATLVPCVGCRRWMETVYAECSKHGYSALDPFYIETDGTLHVAERVARDDRALHRHLVANYCKYALVCEHVARGVSSRRSRRCALHSFEFACTTPHCTTAHCDSWDDVWAAMSVECREEVCIVETDALGDMFHTYQQKHKFCTECRAKLSLAYDCLLGKVTSEQEPQLNASLYSGLKYCAAGEHIHVKACLPYLNSLVDRAQAEMHASSRERHAKTLEMGQVEVVTCVGLYLHGRLCRLSTHMRTLHQAFQLLYSAAAMCTYSALKAQLDERSRAALGDLDSLCAAIEGRPASGKKARRKNKDKLDKQVDKCQRRKSRSRTPSPETQPDSVTAVSPAHRLAADTRQLERPAAAPLSPLQQQQHGDERHDDWTPAAATRIKAKRRTKHSQLGEPRHATAGQPPPQQHDGQTRSIVLYSNRRRGGAAGSRLPHSSDACKSPDRRSASSWSGVRSRKTGGAYHEAARSPVKSGSMERIPQPKSASPPPSTPTLWPGANAETGPGARRDDSCSPASADHGYSSREGSPPSPQHAQLLQAQLHVDQSGCGAGASGISSADIEWYRANAALVAKQRLQLRQTLWHRWTLAQEKLANASNGVINLPNEE